MRDYKIYVHTAPNGKRYVGITRQKLNRRWRYGEGYKRCVYFYKAIKKYGWDNITHQVLVDGLTKSQAEALEKQFIERWNTRDKRFGYNSRSGGNANSSLSAETIAKIKMAKRNKTPKGKDSPFYGKHPSDVTRMRMSQAKQGKYEGANNPKAKQVQMLDENGNVLNTFDTIMDATKFCGKSSPSMICMVCKGKFKTAYGHRWKYA